MAFDGREHLGERAIVTDEARTKTPEPGAEPSADRAPILRSFGFLTGGRILGDLSTFLYFVILSRQFGQEGAGEYSLALALAGLFVVFSDFGLYYYSVKELSRSTKSSMADHSHVFCARLILCGATLLLLLLALPLMPLSVEIKLLVALIATAQLGQVLVQGFAAVFVARGQAHAAGVLELLVKALGAAAGIAIVVNGGSLVMAAAVLPLVSLLILVLAYGMVSRTHGAISLRTSWQELVALLRVALPYALSELLRFVSVRTDVILLGFLIGPVAAGIYNVAYRLVWFLQLIANYAAIAILPEISRLSSLPQDEMQKLFNLSLSIVILVGVPSAAGIFLIAPELILLIYGPEFPRSILILQVLSAVLFFSSVKLIIGMFLTGTDRQAIRTKIEWWVAGVNIVSNLVLISIFGVLGATFAALLSEFLVVVSIAASLHRMINTPRVLSRLWMSVLASAAFVGLIAALPDLPLAIEIALCVMTYGAILCLFAGLRRDELRFVVAMVRAIARWVPSTRRAPRPPR